MTVQTDAGERDLSRAESERMRCDAAFCEQGGRNTTTIPPRVRREVLARDKHRCQAPGCGRTRFLEVHHIVSRQQGESNQADNLVTLCAACHRLWHERGLGVAQTPAQTLLLTTRGTDVTMGRRDEINKKGIHESCGSGRHRSGGPEDAETT